MAIEQMNISLSPQMARFIRGKVKNGEYTNMSEVVRDAVRRLQEDEAVKSARTRLADFEAGLARGEREGIRRGVADFFRACWFGLACRWNQKGRHDDLVLDWF